MRTRDYYRTEVSTAPVDATAHDIADRMGDRAVGSVVILDADGQAVGIVTDRDLVCRVVAPGLDPDVARAGEVMSKPLISAEPQESVERVVARMRTAGVRRVPVLRDGHLVGLVSLDDLVVQLGRELDDLGEAARGAVLDARRRRRRARRREEVEETLAELRASVEQAGRDVADFLSREFDSLRERLRRAPRSSDEE
jgi:CBS domain-containing protein